MGETSRLRGDPKYTSLAWEELVSKSPGLQDSVLDQQALRARLEKLAGMLGSHREIADRIDKLHSAGAETHKVLGKLAFEVVMQQCRGRRSYWLSEMLRKKLQHKSLAAKIRKVANEIEKTYCDEASHPDLWEVALRLARERPVISAAEKVPTELLSLMRACSTELDVMGHGLGRLCKSEAPYFNRESTVLLMEYVHTATGNIKPHFQILSELLEASYRIFKIDARPPTKESLQKTFTRHVARDLKR